MLKKLRIEFENEEGSDYGGLTSEWLSLISDEVFNPNYALFTLSANVFFIKKYFLLINIYSFILF